MLDDRGTHIRGISQAELEKMGADHRGAALDSLRRLGKVERHGASEEDCCESGHGMAGQVKNCHITTGGF